jgi:hypothetical protein
LQKLLHRCRMGGKEVVDYEYKKHPSWKLRGIRGMIAKKPRKKLRDKFTVDLISEILDLREIAELRRGKWVED